MDDEATLDIIAALAGLPVPPEYREGVLRQWRLNRMLAEPLLEFDLPETCHPAPIFTP